MDGSWVSVPFLLCGICGINWFGTLDRDTNGSYQTGRSGQRHPGLVESRVKRLSMPVLPVSIVTGFNFVNTVTVVVDWRRRRCRPISAQCDSHVIYTLHVSTGELNVGLLHSASQSRHLRTLRNWNIASNAKT